MASAVYTLGDFVADAQRIVATGGGDQQAIEAISAPLARLIERPDCLADLEITRDPDPERGFSIFRAENLSILAVVWRPGSRTPIHNHNGWAIEGVIRGRERNRNFARLDGASEPWRAKLEETDPTIVTTGQTTALALPPSDIHQV